MATITLGCSEAADRNSPGVDKLRRLLEHECEGQVRHGLHASLEEAQMQGLCACHTGDRPAISVCNLQESGPLGQEHRCA